MYTLFQNQETVFETKSLKSAGSSLSAVYFQSFLCVFFFILLSNAVLDCYRHWRVHYKDDVSESMCTVSYPTTSHV